MPGHRTRSRRCCATAVASDGPVYLRLDGRPIASPMPTGGGWSSSGADSGPTIVAVGRCSRASSTPPRISTSSVLYAATIRPFDAETLRAIAGTPEVILVEPTLAGTSARAPRRRCATARPAHPVARRGASRAPSLRRAVGARPRPWPRPGRGSAPRSTRSSRPERATRGAQRPRDRPGPLLSSVHARRTHGITRRVTAPDPHRRRRSRTCSWSSRTSCAPTATTSSRPGTGTRRCAGFGRAGRTCSSSTC